MGYWEWIVLGVDAAMQDFQGKGSCHSLTNHINKVLAWSKYLPHHQINMPLLLIPADP